jgi:hypothetical protein
MTGRSSATCIDVNCNNSQDLQMLCVTIPCWITPSLHLAGVTAKLHVPLTFQRAFNNAQHTMPNLTFRWNCSAFTSIDEIQYSHSQWKCHPSAQERHWWLTGTCPPSLQQLGSWICSISAAIRQIANARKHRAVIHRPSKRHTRLILYAISLRESNLNASKPIFLYMYRLHVSITDNKWKYRTVYITDTHMP